MTLVQMAIGDIKPYENNPRKNDCAVDAVAESIRQCGYVAPIIVDEDNVVLAGHTRLKALIKLGYTTANCLVASGLTAAQKRKYRLLDNKTGELAEWDFDKLLEELQDLDFEGFDFGFDMAEAIESPDDKYTNKITAPQYEITGENPDVHELFDDSKTRELLQRITDSDIQDEAVKEFLIAAAYRHLIFNYAKIAEFYAHADKDVQELMEESALVIIDIDDAIRGGYVELSNKIGQFMSEEEEDDET